MDEVFVDEKSPLVSDHDFAPASPLLLDMVDDEDGDLKGSHGGNNLGLINGVVVPCLLNIVGGVLFLRLSWATGQAGYFGVLIMLTLGTLQTSLTALSMR